MIDGGDGSRREVVLLADNVQAIIGRVNDACTNQCDWFGRVVFSSSGDIELNATDPSGAKATAEVPLVTIPPDLNTVIIIQ